MTVSALARPEIRDLLNYETAESRDCTIQMHANEAPMALDSKAVDGLNRYPALRPETLTRSMANLYDVDVDNVLVTRGSSEGIDLLIRTFCQAGRDDILLTPPAFVMYKVYAAIQGATVTCVPLQAEDDFAVDTEALLAARSPNTKLIFLCSPNNPVGTLIPRDQILQILQSNAGSAVVVVDEAYVEFSDADSLVPLVSMYDNLVVLRTLSKAFALAGARCGAVIASAEIIRLLGSVLPPYALSSPVIESAERALSDKRLSRARQLISETITERERLREELDACDAVDNVWPSQANFLFVRLSCIDAAKDALATAGIVVRTFENDSLLQNCARITVGLERNNDRLINAIRSLR